VQNAYDKMERTRENGYGFEGTAGAAQTIQTGLRDVAAQTACATTYPPDFTHQNPPGLIVYFYNNPSHCLTHFNSDVSLQSILEREPFSAKQRRELACLGKLGSFTQNVSVVNSSFARQHRQQGEDARVV
jgi:hypothetical protein